MIAADGAVRARGVEPCGRRVDERRRSTGDPLPRMILDRVLMARFESEFCARCDLWWHGMPVDG